MANSYMGKIGVSKHNQLIAFKRILSNHGIHKNKDVAELLDISPQAYQYKIKDGFLTLNLTELRKIALKLDLDSNELSKIIRG